MDLFNFLLFYYLLNNELVKNKEIIEHILNVINKHKIDNDIKWKKLLSYFIKITLHKRQFKNDQENYNSKDIFYRTILSIYEYYPKYIENLILNDVFSQFGYYKDYIKIWELLYSDIKHKYDLNNESDIDIIYKKYNNIIVNLSYILIKKKNDELKQLDEFIKQFKLFDPIFINGKDYFLDLDNHFKIQNISSFIKTYNSTYYCKLYNFRQLKLSKVSQWLPRENKYESKNIFWFKKINNKYKKFNCYDYLILVDKILFKNKNIMNVNNCDKKIFRKETSILNICLENPNVYLCNNNREFIDFDKCGSKFIKNHMNHILFKNNDNTIETMKGIFDNLRNNVDILYKLNNLNICKYHLVSFLKHKIKKKKYNPLFLDYKINIDNYQDLSNDIINDIVNKDCYKLIEII